MKHKVLATIQDPQSDIKNYLDYNAHLARDFNLTIELVASSPRISMSAIPGAVTGHGVDHKSQTYVEKKTLEFNTAELDKHVEFLKLFHPHVEANIKIGNLEGRVLEDGINEEALLWTINQKSGDTLINQLIGTTETDISKNTTLPSLTIPENHVYKKPETILIVIRDTTTTNLHQLSLLMTKMGLRPVYVFHEDKKEIKMEDIMESLGDDFSHFSGTIKAFSLNDESDMLQNIIDREKPDWLAFSNFERSAFERLYKVNTNQLILSSQLPVLNF